MIYYRNGKIIQQNGFDGKMGEASFSDQKIDILGDTPASQAKRRADEKRKIEQKKAQAKKLQQARLAEQKKKQQAALRAQAQLDAKRRKQQEALARQSSAKKAAIYSAASSKSMSNPHMGEEWNAPGEVYVSRTTALGTYDYLGAHPDEFGQDQECLGTSLYDQGEGLGLFKIKLPNPIKAVATVAKVAIAPVKVAAKVVAPVAKIAAAPMALTMKVSSDVGEALLTKTPLKYVDKATGGIASSAVNIVDLNSQVLRGEEITRQEAMKGVGDVVKVAAFAAGGAGVAAIAQQVAAKQLQDVAERSALTRDSALAKTLVSVGAGVIGGSSLADAAVNVAQAKAADLVVKKASDLGLSSGIIGQLAVGTATGMISKGSLDLVSAAQEASKREAEERARELLSHSNVGQKLLQAEGIYNKIEKAQTNLEKAQDFLDSDPAGKVTALIEKVQTLPNPISIVQKIESDNVKAVASAIHQTDVAKAATKELIKVQDEIIKEVDSKIAETQQKLESKLIVPDVKAELAIEMKNLEAFKDVQVKFQEEAKVTVVELAKQSDELKQAKVEVEKEAREKIAETQKTGKLPSSYNFDHPLLMRG